MMRKRFGVPLVLFALFLGVSLIGWSAVFAADQRYVSIDIVEKKVDCISGYLEDVHNLFVPNDFKPILMGQIEADENGLVETGIVDDPTAATNDIVVRASQAALGASPSPENFLVLTAFIGVLTGDPLYADYTDERCDIAEAYEEPYEGEIVLVPQGGDEDPFIPDPDPDPDPDLEDGWIYYGKEYDRDEITDRAATRSTNGVLYMDDDIIQYSESEFHTNWEYGEGGIETRVVENGYGGYHYSSEVTVQGSMIVPPMIMPHMVLGYGGYGGGYENDEGYGFEQSLSGSDLIAEGIMPAPSVDIVEGQYYRYTWELVFGDGDNNAVQESEYTPSFSATLYDDHTIMFDYNSEMLVFPPAFVNYEYWPEIMVGLDPGTIESWDYAATQTDYYGYGGSYQGYYEDVHRDVCTSIGGENMPGAGQPRSDYYTYWENMNLSQQYGRPLDDIYDENGNLCWLPISETFYEDSDNDVGSVSMREHGFDLRDRFIIFEDFQMVADWVEGPEGPDEPFNPSFGYGGFEDFSREDTPHKYTATTGSHDMVVDIDSLDEARAMVIDNPDLLMEIHDFYTILDDKTFIDDDNNEHIVYSRAIKHGAFKPGCYNYCHEGNGKAGTGYASDGTVLADPEFPGIERWPVAWTNTIDMWGYDEFGQASEFNNYKYGLQTVGYGGYYSDPRCFTNYWPIALEWGEEDGALWRINQSGFLAYAVQVEEDIVNRKILGLQSMRAVADSVRDAQATAGIRARDAWFVQTADAQSGRVTKDQHGNWVRAQQYVLRSADNKSVQVVNASLRSGSAMDTMVWTTNFAGEGYAGDLTKLPWGPWLDTQSPDAIYDGRYVYTTENLIDGVTPTPVLDSMSVAFANAAGDSLSESRGFDDRFSPIHPEFVQPITEGSEILNVNGADYGFNAPSGNSYTVVPISSTPSSSSGFDYVLSGGDSLNVRFFDAENGDRGLNTDVAQEYTGGDIDDIWAALGVTEPRWTGPGAQINGNLEIAISNQGTTNLLSQDIDVIYIPMSRMLWKGEGRVPH